MVRIHNVETGEIVDRKMTDAEFTKYQAEQEDHKSKQAQQDAKAQAKAALLERLGITADEAALLLS